VSRGTQEQAPTSPPGVGYGTLTRYGVAFQTTSPIPAVGLVAASPAVPALQPQKEHLRAPSGLG
jgi:hypothetical protein